MDLHGVRALPRQLADDIALMIDHVGVIAGAAEHQVRARAPVEAVRASPAHEVIIPRGGREMRRDRIPQDVHHAQIGLRHNLGDAGRCDHAEGVGVLALGPVAGIAEGLHVERDEVVPAVDGEVRRTVRPAVTEQVEGGDVRARCALGEADPPQDLGDLVLERADGVVLARNAAVVRVEGERRVRRQPHPTVDGGGTSREQPKRLGLARADVIRRPIRWVGSQVGHRHGVVVGRRRRPHRRGDLGVAIAGVRPKALRQRAWIQRLPRDHAIAEHDVDGDRGGDHAFPIGDRRLDRGLKPGRRVGDASVVGDVDVQSHGPACPPACPLTTAAKSPPGRRTAETLASVGEARGRV